MLIDDDGTSIENFSNEIFYEIFDYLDGCEIYHAFVSLNHRFRQLVDSPSLLLKLKLHSQSNRLYQHIYELLMDFNQHQILSIHLSTSNEDIGVITACSIDSSFSHLESLVIGPMEADILMSLIFDLSSLPRLFSLSIDISNNLQELNEIYELVFHLPKLRFMKLSTNGYRNVTLSLPMAPSQSFSPIEHLVIDHSCTSQNLSTILSYTPHLSCLKVTYELYIEENLPIISPMTMSNLQDLSIDVFSASFDEFATFISQKYTKLKVLRLVCDDRDCLDAHRWEELISQYLPELEALHLKCFHSIDDDLQSPRYPERRNQFFSSFWIERQWILEAEADSEIIVCSVHPYKYIWKSFQ